MIVDDIVYVGGSDYRFYVLTKGLRVITHHPLSATPKSMAKFGYTIVAGLDNGEIIEIAGSEQIKMMHLHSGEILSLSDGYENKVVTTGNDFIKIWDMEKRVCKRSEPV